MGNSGSLTIISGFSGTGKGTVIRTLLERYDNYFFSVSVTTRKPRPGEEHGKDYIFISKEEFEGLIKNDHLLEYAQYVEHYYGTPSVPIDSNRNAGKNVILDIEILGALQVREKCHEAKMVFLVPPSGEALYKRLVGRGTESSAKIRKRLRRALEEAEHIPHYDCILVNDDLDKCVEMLHGCITDPSLMPEYGISMDSVKIIRDDIENIVNDDSRWNF